ncbi:tRNA N6-adenosine threonylcarbamoyltransferase [Grifola frondosa]|uniref:N(6)-L-threonylcarbamoyladenine synthase n=1 Tax=Grifola frondosa TaxID=5627 RepID=A0A1C7LMY7_GRIFR|nr:tRNA N6-adenosine threonylcarbamoyltransferase [Grifola frondosa]
MQHALSVRHTLASPRHLSLLALNYRRTSHACHRKFTVLALESSADDTCAAVVTSDRKILSNVVIKQNSYHESYGGIQPYVAMSAHQQNMPGAVRKALTEANMDVTNVDGIAFTRGPGMPGCLGVCSNAAKTLASALGKPIVGVHHMHAHALTPLLTTPLDALPVFPFLTLLISGGHTLLLLANSPTSFHTLATSLDESIGRAFDKMSRTLDLPWSALGPGAALEQFCLPSEDGVREEDVRDATATFIAQIPRPVPGRLTFSYTGLRSNVTRLLQEQESPTPSTRRALARAFQTAAVRQLEDKLMMALRQCEARDIAIRHVVVSGGVASNMFLRSRLRLCLDAASPETRIALVFPPPALCTDNAVMIAWASMDRFLSDNTDDYTIDIRHKWDIEDLTKEADPYKCNYTAHLCT